jgi:cytidylate kinase
MFGDELTIEEMNYWSIYGIITSASVFDVDISNMSFENAMETIEDAIKKRKKRWQPKESSRKRVS